MINLEKWNSLPKNYQAVLTAASEYTNLWMVGKYDNLNPGALKRLVAGGAKLQPFSQAIMEASLKAANEVYAETSKTNADFKKVWDSITAYRSDQYLWWQVAEYGYDSFMIRERGKGWK
jgi:TRAP-type mannitol/chloroaromatic compound transport system substrate-binding protein